MRLPIYLLLCLGLNLLPGMVMAESLIVGTKLAPPFVIQEEDGSLSGISIDLWQEIATELGIESGFEPFELNDLILGLQDGRLDASVAALTVTAEREASIDFSHPFYTTGLAIAVPKKDNPAWAAVARFFSWEFLTVLAALAGLLLVVGFAIWLFERKRNTDEFGGSAVRGLGSGFWWAAVTMTTVGYGDKAPQTPGGRLVGLVWMFAAIIIISSFTAAIATSLTVSQLKTGINGVDDLYDVRVATVDNSSSALALKDRGIHYSAKADLPSALDALTNGQVDAVVYDKPIIQYMSRQEYSGRVQVLPKTFERQDYAIGLPNNSPQREAINRALIKVINSRSWQDILQRYLGKNQ